MLSPDAECVAFLRWALPRLALRWPGFRKVRRQVCRRIGRRARELGLAGLADYRRYLDEHPAEWSALRLACRVTISRFLRDRGVFEHLGHAVLPELAAAARHQGRRILRAWSVGCAGGEEPYSLALTWRMLAACPDLKLEIVGGDVDPGQIARGRAALYPAGALRELPRSWRDAAFLPDQGRWRLRDEMRSTVSFRVEDVENPEPLPGPADLVLCRNLVFTYFDEGRQRAAAGRFHAALRPGGCLVLGKHEALPNEVPDFAVAEPHLRIYRALSGCPSTG